MRALVLVALTVAACGVRNKPLPPELVQPTPPSDLVAKSMPEGMQLTWKRPTTYTSGQHMRDLAGFDIERANGPDGIDYAQVGFFELTDQTRFRQERLMTWFDTSAVAGSSYRYRVIATTLDGYRSTPSESVAIEYRPGATAEAPPPAPAAPVKRKRQP
jgi:hypothetical protein